MSRTVVLSDTRDMPLLQFIWKWKVSTAAALMEKFFSECSGKTAYNRLLSLRQAGLIGAYSDGSGKRFVISLERKGFDLVAPLLPPLREQGYKSANFKHDLVVAAFHLGEWLHAFPNGVGIFTEQQLRRFDLSVYPSWVPKTNLHRPDGYTRIRSGEQSTTYAIEVELFQKCSVDYEKVAQFYNHFRGISRVVWLVPRKSMAETIFQKMCLEGGRESERRHSFVLFDGFHDLGWQTPIVAGGDAGMSLLSLFKTQPQDSHRIATGSNLGHFLLDTRKSPHTSNAYRGLTLADFCD